MDLACGDLAMIDVEQFKRAMRCIVSGVAVIATRTPEGDQHGLTITAVAAVSAEPPTLLCCVNRSASAAPFIRDNGHFSVNILPLEATELSQRFSGSGPAEERFLLGTWTQLITGAPILEEAIAAFDCRIAEHRELGSHFVFFGEIHGVKIAENPPKPLLYGMAAYGTFQPN